MKSRFFKMMPFFAADGAGAGGEGEGDGNLNAGGNGETTFTQAQVDAIVAQRLARAQPKTQEPQGISAEDVRKMIADEIGKQAPPSTQPPIDSSAMDTEAQNMLNEARKIRVRATFDVLAVKAGINPDVLDDVAKMADLDGIDVSKDGTVSTEALQTQVDGLLGKFPMLKQQNGSYSGGGNPGGGSNKPEAGAFGAEIGQKVALEKTDAAEKFKEFF